MVTNEKTDVAVIGGGLSGLAAATYLARAGKSVTLFERSHLPGGRAVTQRCGEFLFNEGPHAVYKAGQGIKILRELGLKFHGGLVALSGFGLRDGQLYPFPTQASTLFDNGLLGGADKLELMRVLARVLTLRPDSVAEVPLQVWLDHEVHRPAVRDVIKMLIRVATYTDAPEIQSAGSALAQLRLSLSSVYYLDGGWQTLVDGLVKAAEAAGVRIMLNARVAAVEHNGAVEGVRLVDKTVIPVSAAIIAGSPSMASALVDGGANPVLRARAESAIPVKLACLDLGLRRLPYPDRKVVLGVDSPLYYSVHSTYAKLAPAGRAMVHVAKYLAPDTPNDPRADERELENLMDTVQPGWRDEVVEQRYLPNMVVMNALVTASGGGLPGRPGLEVPGIDNLCLVGDWVGPRGLLFDAALSSARQASNVLMEKVA